jgi:hydroxypyruvate reductase
MSSGKDQSITETMREQALAIFHSAIEAVDPVAAIHHHVSVEDGSLLVNGERLVLNDYDRIWIVGGGKGAAPMAQAIENLLGDRIFEGTIVVKDGHGLPLKRVCVHEAGHPVPDQRGVQGGEDILSLMKRAKERDLVICVLTGGGSSLLVAPVQGVSLKDKQEVTSLLLACGATIHEVNAVRKHLSRIKGGGLARFAHPARVVSLILSDVIGDDLDVIASGPTVPDPSTFHEAKAVLKRYDIWKQVPTSVKERIEMGVMDKVEETVEPGDSSFQNDVTALVGTNLQALEAAEREAEAQGYHPLILSAMVEGETREVAKMHAGIAKEILASGHPIPTPACILFGGETTVTLQGEGKGGRNMEFALASALALEEKKHVVVLSGGTDGTDGPTDAAGAIVDGETVGRAHVQGLDPVDHLRRNDAYPFFQSLQDLVITSPTRTNVMDVCIMLVRD